MLKKGEPFTQNAIAQRKAKNISDPQQSYADANKENFSTKSLFEHSESEANSKLFKTGQQSNYGSTMVSPTFQSNNIISLKQQIYKQNNPNKGFKQVNLSLIDYTQKMDSKQQKRQVRGLDGKKLDEVAVQKERLLQHYKNKKYWSKIQKLFQQQGVDAVLAWEDSIKRYKTVKDNLQQIQVENEELKKQLSQKSQKLVNLEKQIAIQKSETRVLSQKKCRGCQNLQQKQKEYFQLYEQSKRQTKQIKQLEEATSSSNKLLAKMQQRYLQEKGIKEQMQKRRALLKQELDKKSLKLQEREKMEKQMINQMQKLQSEQRKNTKLHIQFQQLKQFKYQAEKTIGKVEQKSKKDIIQYQERVKQLQQERNIYENQMNKLRNELSEIRPKLLKAQLELQNEASSINIKLRQFDQSKKKHMEAMGEEVRKKNELQSLLTAKEDEINRAYHMLDEAENTKTKLQFELSHQRKNSEEKDEQMCKYLEIIKQLEQKCKEVEEYECRSKQSNNFYNLAKTKNPNSCSVQQQGSANMNVGRKMQIKISQIFFKMKQINEDGMDSLQRRKSREEESQEKQYMNSFQAQKYVNYIHSELSRFINKFEYFQKEKDILRRNTEDQLQCKDIQLAIMKKQVTIKEKVISSLVSFIPEDMKDSALGFLELAQYVSGRDQQQSELDEQFEQMRESLQNEGRAWRENYQRMKFKFRKLEDDLAKLQEQNQQLKRKTKGKQAKKTFTTDYDCYREGVTKKDIRKKYNFD